MDMVSLGIVALIFILLIVFTVMTRKTWHWVNIVFVILTFLTGVGATAGMAKVFKLRTDLLKKVVKAERDVEKNEEEALLAVQGDPTATVYGPKSLRGATLALELATKGRGRVWSGGTVGAGDGNLRKFQFAIARPPADDTQLPLKDVQLYAFADGPVVGQSYPKDYIGAVMVTEESPESLTIRPEFIPNVQEWREPTATWSLFEKMPLDRRDTFKKGFVAYIGTNPEGISEDAKAFAAELKAGNVDITKFRQLLMTDFLPAEKFQLDPSSKEYERLIDRYAFDGLKIGTIQTWLDANRNSEQFQPKPEEVFVEYKFNKSSSKSYKVDTDGNLETDGPFNPLGQAYLKSLHAGKDIEFAEGDTVRVDQLTARGYQNGPNTVAPFRDGEQVTEGDLFYYRSLRDYPYVLGDLSTQSIKFQEEMVRVKNENAIQTGSLEDAEAQLNERINATAGLEQDSGNLKTDLETIEALLSRRQEENRNLAARVAALESEIRSKYQQIQQQSRDAEGL